jgi:type II secretory ATPase GspE/PulE/Tfp pilus assembly ATPase PilB-like protein
MSFLRKKLRTFNLLNLSGSSKSTPPTSEDQTTIEDANLLEGPSSTVATEVPTEEAAADSPIAEPVVEAAIESETIQSEPTEVPATDLGLEIEKAPVTVEPLPSENRIGGVRIVRPPAIRIFASQVKQSEKEKPTTPTVETVSPSNPFDDALPVQGESEAQEVVGKGNEDTVAASSVVETQIENEERKSESVEGDGGTKQSFTPINPFDQVVSSDGDTDGDVDESSFRITPLGQTSGEQVTRADDDDFGLTIKPLNQTGNSGNESEVDGESSEIIIQSLPTSGSSEDSDQEEVFNPIQMTIADEPAGEEHTPSESQGDVGFVIVKRDPLSDPTQFAGDGDDDSIDEPFHGVHSEAGSDRGDGVVAGDSNVSIDEESDDTSIAVRSTLQKKYTPEELREFAQFLPKTVAARYEALILNSWTTGFNTRQFEVGLVHIKNGDHRNGVLRTLKVSPLDVKFVPLEEEVFKYLHESIYDPKAEVEAKLHEQKKQSQKTKAWGEGQSTLSPEEAFAIQAAETEFDIGSEEWMDLTNIEEYERNINRNESELTTQEFIRLILMEFLRSGSSDMHIESGQPTGRIRFRYDSEMFTRWDDIPFVKIKQVAAGLAETAGKDATRMKFKDIDSTIKVKALRDGVPADVELRFASQPTLYSPSIVLRSQLKPIRDLNVVGFLPRQVEDLEVAYSQKRGIIVVTGATGSGKTNTLESIYAKLEETDKFKIIEIGEPIEIRSGRRTQISLRPNTPFTWWDAFYSCLRSDPDIIGIGELRSAEHLSVAINAALTGHLVLSTFHAASVEDTLTRMFQMGIPRENLATGINMILAQTLIKRLCEKCKVVDETASEQYGKTVYKSAGCPECFNKGTRGRTAMAELLYFSDEVKQWIQDKNMSARDVVQRATREGHLLPMKIVAREKVMAGLASTHETAGALGYLESSESWNNGGAFNYAEDGDKPHTQEISPGDIPAIEDFIEGEIIEE